MNVARGTLHRPFGVLGYGVDNDIETRRETYSRRELNSMYENMAAEDRALIMAYLEGCNHALHDMLKLGPALSAPLELKLFRQSNVAAPGGLFGTVHVLTEGQGLDPYYQGPGTGAYPSIGFQLTPELVMAFATLQVRTFGYELWDDLEMAEDLAKLIAAYGEETGTELWDDYDWKHDPLAPSTVPDPRVVGYDGAATAGVPIEKRMEIAELTERLRDRVLGRSRLPGYPARDYSAAIEHHRRDMAEREAFARKWGAWPALGSYAALVSPARSATGNPWVGGFPQTGIQVPSIMHFSEIRGETINSRGMFFVGAPFSLIGMNDHLSFTTTTAHQQTAVYYIETLTGGNFDLLRYDRHGQEAEMAMRIELVHRNTGAPVRVPIFRTNKVCSVNGCSEGDRPVIAFTGTSSGTAGGATASTLVDPGAGFGDLAGGHVAIVNGTGAGQMRVIESNSTTTLEVAEDWATSPDATSEYVVASAGEEITAVAVESPVWMEEGTTAAGFANHQRSASILEWRRGARFVPGSMNFYAADNQPYNGVGSDHGTGNIGYVSAGFMRIRDASLDPRLPLDGTQPNAFDVVTGVVGSAGPASLSDTGAFAGLDMQAKPLNWVYDNPDDNGEEFIVVITAGDGYKQSRRISSNTDDTLSLEHGWGVIPSVGDTYAVYRVWATPEVINPAEGFTANWNNKQAVANDYYGNGHGRQHRAEVLFEYLARDDSIDRNDLHAFNQLAAGVIDPGTPGRYLLPRLAEALAAHGDCDDMTVYGELVANNDFPARGREFTNPLVAAPAGDEIAAAVRSAAPSYVVNWARALASDIYNDEYSAAGLSPHSGREAIGWALHAIDAAAGDLPEGYQNKYSGDYFNGSDWREVVRDSFCAYVAANPTVGTLSRRMSDYNHPLSALPCQAACDTPIEFDPTPYGDRGTWEQIVEVGETVKGEFIFPLGQSGHIAGNASGFFGNYLKQDTHTTSLQPLWRDWRMVPILDVCSDVEFGVDEDGDRDGDGVLDAYERWYFGDTGQAADSDSDGDGASLATEFRWGSDPTSADTDGDTVADGSDVAPQDRLCVAGELKKLLAKDSEKAGKDKVVGKWEVPLQVCMGGDFRTACESDSDCGGGRHLHSHQDQPPKGQPAYRGRRRQPAPGCRDPRFGPDVEEEGRRSGERL